MKLFMYFKLIAKVYLNQPNCSRETNESKIEYYFGEGVWVRISRYMFHVKLKILLGIWSFFLITLQSPVAIYFWVPLILIPTLHSGKKQAYLHTLIFTALERSVTLHAKRYLIIMLLWTEGTVRNCDSNQEAGMISEKKKNHKTTK